MPLAFAGPAAALAAATVATKSSSQSPAPPIPMGDEVRARAFACSRTCRTRAEGRRRSVFLFERLNRLRMLAGINVYEYVNVLCNHFNFVYFVCTLRTIL